MSSRDPLWYCHECRAEMRPLMMPDPHCASCSSTFVEKMENPGDDPREYRQNLPGGLEDPPGMDNFLLGLHHMLERRSPERSPTSPSGRAATIQFSSSGPGGTRVITFGGPNTLTREPGDIPSMSQFLRRGPANFDDDDQVNITGPMMAQYLMALLSARRPGAARGGTGSDPFAELFGGPGPFGAFGAGGQGHGGDGRWGDYVFNQEALDQIITQIMENSNSGRPVPATSEIIENLPREVLEAGSPRLQNDCAVCKDQFKLETEDPEEQVVVTLPCKHPFHEGCILPWLKSSGTCPVCRFALIPQPEHHPPGQGPAGNNGSRPTSPSGGSPDASGGNGNGRNGNSHGGGNGNSNGGGGIFGSFFGSRQSGHSNGRRSSAGQSSASRRIPGAWGDSVD